MTVRRQREKPIQTMVIAHARKRGVGCRKYANEDRRAAPDYLLMYLGSIVFIEFKAPGKLPNKAQQREHEELRAYGFRVFVCDNIDKGRAFVDEFIDTAIDRSRETLRNIRGEVQL